MTIDPTKLAKEIENTGLEVKETNLTVKSMSEAVVKLTELMGEVVKKSEVPSEELLELKSKYASLEQQVRDSKRNNVDTSSNDEETLGKIREFAVEVKSKIDMLKDVKEKRSLAIDLKSFAGTALKDSANLTLKSLRSYDSASAGAEVMDPVRVPNVDINTRPVSQISPFVTNINLDRNIRYTEIDWSGLDVYESDENKGKLTGQEIEKAVREIVQSQHSVKVPVSDRVLHMNTAGSFDIDPIQELLSKIEQAYTLRKDKRIVLDYIAAAQRAGTRVNKHISAAANKAEIVDFLDMVSKLKPIYTNGQNSLRILADVAVVDSLYKQIGNDGHAMFEYFDYRNRLAGLKTSRGVIQVVGVESEFFTNYFAFDNNGAATTNKVTAGYNIAQTGNGGKVAAMVTDLAQSYTMLNSPASILSIDTSFRDQLVDGKVWAGKIGYFGGVVKLEEAVSMLIVKN